MVKTTDESSTKRRKKTTTSTSSDTVLKSEEDIYRQVITHEETEALNRSPDKDASLYCRTCENIRKILHEINLLKNQSDTDENQTRITVKRKELSLLFVLLKKLNRYEKIRTKASRDALNKEKQRVDSTQLQLHNLIYELEHLKKEITKCLQFKSKDEEIELVSIDEFYNEAPENIARPDVTKTDEHQLRLARLEWELMQRKELSKSCHKLQLDKTQAAAEIVNKQERLDGLAPRLNQILDVTKPLKEYFGFSTDHVQQQHKLAYLLPDPLFLLYFQVDAFQQVYDKTLSVSINGDEDEAYQLKNSCVEDISDSESDPEIDDNNDGGRSKRHHRKVSRTDRHEEKRKKLLAVHPLNVEIVLHETSNNHLDNVRLQITFYYLTQLHIVTIKVDVLTPSAPDGVTSGDMLSKDTILSELFENDNGVDSPNTVNNYQLRQVGLDDDFSKLIEQLGRPYVWVQRVCGLDFLADNVSQQSQPIVNRQLSQLNVEIVLKMIKKRFRARLMLSQQIKYFEQCNLSIFASINIDEYPNTFISKLELWKRVNWQDFIKCKASGIFIEQQIINTNDIIYRAIIIRNAAKLTAFIAIKHNYPIEKPIFCLSIDWNGEWDSSNCEAIRDMERVINVDWPDKFPKNKEAFILGAQLRRLLACFDIYLETMLLNEFPQQKIFIKAIRGRNRKRPYKYLKVGGGIFTQ